MRSNYQPKRAIARLFTSVAAIAVVVSGVTFAILQSQQDKLAGNTIETASANLQVSRDGNSYATTQNGFDFNNLVPGGAAVPGNGGYSFYLKNSGGSTLALKFAVSSQLSNPQNVDLNKVNVIITPADGDQTPLSFSLQSLVQANTSGGVGLTVPASLAPGASAHYLIAVSMASDANVTSGASLGNIDFAFTGNSVAS